MAMTRSRTARWLAPWLALATGAALLAGCSSDKNAGQEAAAEEENKPVVAKGAENADRLPDEVEDSGEYPNLASVPDAPEEGMSPNQRLIIEEGLLADRENARYQAGPPPKMLPQPGGQGPSMPSGSVESTDLSEGSMSLPGSADDVTLSDQPTPGQSQSQETASSAAQASQSSAQEVPPGEQVMLVAIRFPEDSAQPPPQTDQVLEQVAMIQKQENAFLRIVGHTSAQTGSEQAKMALANERAGVIASRLASFGAARSKLLVEGVGDSEPVAGTAGGQDVRQNNRVEIYMIR